MRIIIVDDEAPLLRELAELLSRYPDFELAGCYTNPLQALEELEATRPAVAFLDIEMRTLDGIELAERMLATHPEMDVLFVTAYNQYAVTAFEINAIDYILKPVRPERLDKAVARIRRKRGLKSEKEKKLLEIRFFGKFALYYGKEAVKWSRGKPRELLAYFLANESNWIDKFKICDDLWPESPPNQALRNLQTAVWAIRKCLRDYGISAIQISYANDRYFLKLEDGRWDLRQYDRALTRYLQTDSLAAGMEAAELYREDYLADEDWRWANPRRADYALKQRELLVWLSAGKKTALD
ncbi:response regulator [Gorillibacterium sp. sgz500922]|uniref:response regulator n=1 Tax=Gorillibacterium sp. sgz500922 TaxID=3446694 RepID=UPI003F67A056